MRVLALLLLLCGCTTTTTTTTTTSTKDTKGMVISGVVTNEGVECPAVRGEDGKLYTIVGADREKLKPGVRVKITGEPVQMSTCMQGTTIEATRIEVMDVDK